MLTSFVMKEWLKVKWIVIGLAIAHGIVALLMYYDLSNMFKSYRANEIVLSFLTYEVVYYVNVKYAVLLSALMIGIFQFFPEINQSRLKLTFHLPVKESTLVLQMAATGAALLIALNIFDTVAVSLITAAFFPREFFESMVTTTLPWYMGSICAYFWVVIVFIEPNWVKRILLLCIGAGIVSLFFSGEGYGTYASSLMQFGALTVLTGTAIFLSAYNYKRGIV